MPSSESLSKIISEVANGSRFEGDFFHAMLDRTMYGITPISDDHPRLRLFMFQQPDGQYFVPLFTDENKAQSCAQSVCRVIHGTGRELLEMTLGALVMINPNDEGCTLYPEECRTLLTTGMLGSFGHEKTTTAREVLAGPPQTPPDWLLGGLKELYATLPFIEEAYVVDVQNANSPDQVVLTIVIVTPGVDAERAARATLAATYAECSRRNFAFDVTVDDPQGVRNSLTEHALRFYSRS